MTKISRQGVSLQDAIYELSLAKAVPDAALVDEFVLRYPEFASELTDAAIELSLFDMRSRSAAQSTPSDGETSATVARAMSLFANRLYAVKKEKGVTVSSLQAAGEQAFDSLDRPGVRALVERMGINSTLFMKIRDRKIETDTIPLSFQERLGREIGVSPEVIAAHLAAPPRIASRANFKSAKKPATGEKQSFDEAVKDSGLTIEQQKLLLER